MRKKIAAVVILALLVLLGVLGAHLQFTDQWYDGTSINGVDFSGMSLEETISSLDESGDYSITLNGKNGGTDTITGEEISLETDMAAQIEELFQKQHRTLFLANWLGAESVYTVVPNVTYDEAALTAALEESVLVTGSEDYKLTEASDAYLAWDGTSIAAVEDDNGTILDFDAAYESICAAIDDLETEIDLAEADVYEPADVRASDLEKYCTQANLYALHWITWEMADGTEESLTPEDLAQWLVIDGDEVSLDEVAVCEWVEELCTKYKTVGVDREFTTHDGETITVSGGDYGWRLNYDEMCEDVLNVIEEPDEDAVNAYLANPTDETKEALAVSLDVVYRQTAYLVDTDTYCDWDPDNYSEVDISEQMVYVYKDGELAYSCICVTGLPNGVRDTTTGVWYIKDKKLTYTMTSETYGYTTPTKYWIRITWSGIGYHYMSRSDWGSWSSSLYKSAGSHGCINLQLSDAESIYSLVSIYDAVIIHD